jgi:hypothetical protein
MSDDDWVRHKFDYHQVSEAAHTLYQDFVALLDVVIQQAGDRPMIGVEQPLYYQQIVRRVGQYYTMLGNFLLDNDSIHTSNKMRLIQTLKEKLPDAGNARLTPTLVDVVMAVLSEQAQRLRARAKPRQQIVFGYAQNSRTAIHRYSTVQGVARAEAISSWYDLHASFA